MAAIENTDGMSEDQIISAGHIKIFELVRQLNGCGYEASLIDSIRDRKGLEFIKQTSSRLTWVINGIKNTHEFRFFITDVDIGVLITDVDFGVSEVSNTVNILISSAGCIVRADRIKIEEVLITFNQLFERLERKIKVKIEIGKVISDFNDKKFNDWPAQILFSFSSTNINIHFHPTEDGHRTSYVSYTMRNSDRYYVFKVMPELYIEQLPNNSEIIEDTKNTYVIYSISVVWSYHKKLCGHNYFKKSVQYKDRFSKEIKDEGMLYAENVDRIVYKFHYILNEIQTRT